ncbi:MAG TPA: phosphate signaling complex protein PhoU [Mariprofundaceae bacterium]|nr:phosphate signaling complex protein PhoU [Mariprofundaceae bacterium]
MVDHTFKRFDIELDELDALIMSMFKVVRKNVKKGLRALFEGNVEIAKLVISQDEAANALEVQVDELARSVIVRHQPAASDLRQVFAATKIVTDLERISDLAASIANNTIELNGYVPSQLASLPDMQEMVLRQLKDARRAYKRQDVQLAQDVLEHDQAINAAFAESQRALFTSMTEHPSEIGHYMALANIAKQIERIGDHTKNIAEMTIYLVVGHEVRHINRDHLAELLEGDDDEEE